MIADFIAGFLTFLSFMVPGFLISLPLLKKTDFDLFEKLVISFIVGIILVPTLGFVYGLLGILFTPLIMLLNVALVSIAGFLVSWKFDALPKKISFNKYSLLLLILILFGVWVRLQSLGPYFYEFDPYFYQMSAQYTVTQGITPRYDKLVGTPDFKDTHRTQPLTSYMEAQMYFIFSVVKGVSTYDPNLLTIVSGLYPVMSGALLAFIMYLLISCLYGKNIGIFAASLTAFIPQLIQKTAAGSQELQPWGIFSLLLVMAFFIITIKKLKENWLFYALLSCVASISVILGSQYNLLLSLIVYSSFVLLSSYFFLVHRDKELDILLKFDLAFFIVSLVSYTLYYGIYLNVSYLSSVDVLSAVVSILFLAFLSNFDRITNKLKLKVNPERWKVVLVALILGLVISFALGLVERAYWFAISTGQVVPLMKTVAEQSPSPDVLFDSLSYLGISFLPHLTLLLAALALLYALYMRNSEVAMPLFVFVFPIAWRGLQTSKYIIQLGIVLAIAISIFLGEALIFFKNYFKKKEEIKIAKYALYGLMGIFLLLHASGPLLELINRGDLYNYLNYVVVPADWNQSMVWIKNNVKPNEGVVSWWDYGHWINWFGDRRSLTRNDHPQPKVDHMVAYNFVEASPEELASFYESKQRSIRSF